MRFSGLLASTFIMICAASPSGAAGVPSQLWNKTISASYTNSQQARGPGGVVKTINGGKTYLIYISSAGRIFARYDRDNRGKLHARYENGPETAQFQFTGGMLVRTARMLSGALIVQISFDQNFQSCTIKSIEGHEAGKSFKWVAIDGKVWETVSEVTYANERCSISEGNGLQ